MSLVLDLGIKRAPGNVEEDLRAVRCLIEDGTSHNRDGYGHAGTYCTAGAASLVTGGLPVPVPGLRLDDVIRELYFAIPYEDRIRESWRDIRGPWREERRLVEVEYYNDAHTKDEVVAWIKHAEDRVRESERHRAGGLLGHDRA
jgi:hypothetical protein